ncbi:MAG: ankyrin repeat domain-containing protein [Gemmatimonadetes bacterium]|nr:ankyrin repeat domain-containing protein [Gemmatimonadota bacterium]
MKRKARSREKIKTLLRGLAILLMVLVSSVWSGAAVHVGATYGLPRLVGVSLALGGRVDALDLKGRTPLFVASRDRRLPVVEVLLRNGAVPSPALHIAIEKGWVGIVSMLLAGGADPDFTAQSGVSALAKALHRSDSEVGAEIAYLLLDAGADPTRGGGKDAPALVLAALESPPLLVEALLAAGADPNPRVDNHTPVQIAVKRERYDVAKLLLEAGADPNPDTGWAALFWAARNQDLAAAELLLAFGADPDPSSPASPLFKAVQDGHVEMVRLFLEHGADPNLTAYGFTVLGTAIGQENEGLVRLLLEAGVNPNGSPERSRSPLERAVELSDAGMVGLLLDAGATVTKELLEYVSNRRRSLGLYPTERERFAAVARLLDEASQLD